MRRYRTRAPPLSATKRIFPSLHHSSVYSCRRPLFSSHRVGPLAGVQDRTDRSQARSRVLQELSLVRPTCPRPRSGRPGQDPSPSRTCRTSPDRSEPFEPRPRRNSSRRRSSSMCALARSGVVKGIMSVLQSPLRGLVAVPLALERSSRSRARASAVDRRGAPPSAPGEARGTGGPTALLGLEDRGDLRCGHGPCSLSVVIAHPIDLGAASSVLPSADPSMPPNIVIPPCPSTRSTTSTGEHIRVPPSDVLLTDGVQARCTAVHPS